MPKIKKSTSQQSKLPTNITPMLATLADQPVDDAGWMYEIKWDGYRAMATINKGQVELISRNAKSFNEKFYPVYNALKKWKVNVVLDGEIVVIDNSGQADFSSLQSWRSDADGELIFYIFDITWKDGQDLTQLPLTARRAILEKIIPQSNIIRLSENFDTTGTAFFKLAQKMKLEGIMAKNKESVYTYGLRTQEWLKIKTAMRQEVVIGGYTKNEGSAKLFSSLLVGVFENRKLQYTGKIGTGFTDKLQREMKLQFDKIESKVCPFIDLPDINKPSRFRPNPPQAKATWLKPKLVCEVSFREMTNDGVMRHPSFEGMRSDKNPVEVVPEKKQSVARIVRQINKSKNNSPESSDGMIGNKKVLKAPAKGERKTLLNPFDETQVRKVNGHDLKFTNLSKVYWPKEKYTKRDLINYYYQVAPYILPYLKDRPQSLNRHPGGINGESFYQKDVSGKVPAWMKTVPYESDPNKHFLVASDDASLLYMASLGCIEINPWSSRIQKPNHPDWCVIDLDPDKTTFNQVIEAAQITHDILQSAGVESYCKTSGSTGLHIYIPLGAKYTYEHSKEFGRVIAKLVHEELPKTTSIERMISNRNKKMYIDFLQNRPQATLAAPYSVRPKPGATVSMPLYWDEVKKGLKMQDFSIANAMARIKETGDLFKPVIGKGIDMKKALAGLMR